jgi:hypothetical protein
MENKTGLKYYAGVGSRETPLDVQLLMADIADFMGRKRFILRSGGAEGADDAFERGAKFHNHPFEIFKPEDATPEAIEIASNCHPNWKACDTFARKAHGRNSMILFGESLRVPVNMVICWTPRGEVVGGTGQTIRMAKDYLIRVINLFDKKNQDYFIKAMTSA